MESAAILRTESSPILRSCFTPSSSGSSSSHVATSTRLVIPPACNLRWRGHSGHSSLQNQLKSISVPEKGNNFSPPRQLEFTRRQQLRVEAVSGKKESSISANETVIPGPSYRIPIVLLGAAGAFIYSDNYLAAAPLGLLGLLLLFQGPGIVELGYRWLGSRTLGLQDLGKELELKVSYAGFRQNAQTTRVRFIFSKDALEVKLGDDLKDSGENVFVGGKNFWKFSSFTNWELWWPNFPILVYFKETQTKPEGQIHFFPLILDGKKVYELMVQRAGPSKTSGPK